MKHTVWPVVLAAMFALTAVPAAGAPGDKEAAPALEEMEHREREMEFAARKADLDHEQKLRELEIKAREVEIDRMRDDDSADRDGNGGGVLVLLIVLTNILLTVWVFKDMNEQKIGRALWVPIVLLAGVFGAILYAIVRNADTRGAAPEAKAKG
jgi:hypothetical protein